MKEIYQLWNAKSIKLRKMLLLIIIAGLAINAHAQLKLGNNPNTINASALLELESTNQGLLLPRLSDQQMLAIAAPSAGLIVYNTDSACAFVYNNSAWTNLCEINLVNFMQFITTSPGMDSIIQIIAENASNQPLVDSIFHAVLVNAGNLSAASGLVTVTNGTKSTLKNVTIDVNKDSLVNVVVNSPVLGDTVISIVTANGKNATGMAPIFVTGGTGATLQPISVSIDSSRIVPLGGTPGQILVRDSFGVSVWGNAGPGDNWGTQVVQHDGTLQGNGTAASPLGVDTAGLATLLPNSPISDTIISIVSTNGKNATGMAPIFVTGGTGATLQPISVSIDSSRIVPLGGTPGQILVRDSFGVSVWGNAGPGDNWGTQVVQHDGTLQGNGTAASPLGVDTAGLATLLPNSPISDTIISIVSTNGKNLSAGSTLVTVTNGVGATLKNTTIDVNKDTLINVVVNSPVLHDSVIAIIADNSNQSPLRDSIFTTVVAQGRNLSSSSPAIIVNGGIGATLQNSSLYIDSAALIHLLIISHLQDSLMNFKGFNAAGTSTSNTFLNLTLGLNNSPNTIAAYELQTLTDTAPFPQFNDFGVFSSGSPSSFTAPVTGYYSLTYTVSLVVNPSLLSVGGTFSWGIALIKTNGTPAIIQTTRNTQTISASALGVLGVATVGTNTVTALVKLNAGDTVSPGLGATSGITLSLLSSNSTIQNFSGYWVK